MSRPCRSKTFIRIPLGESRRHLPWRVLSRVAFSRFRDTPRLSLMVQRPADSNEDHATVSSRVACKWHGFPPRHWVLTRLAKDLLSPGSCHLPPFGPVSSPARSPFRSGFHIQGHRVRAAACRASATGRRSPTWYEGFPQGRSRRVCSSYIRPGQAWSSPWTSPILCNRPTGSRRLWRDAG